MSTIVNTSKVNGTNTATATAKVSVNSENPQTTLSITKTANVQTVFVGDNLIYTITVKNTGSAVATNVTFTDNLPPEVQFVSATTTQGTITNTGNNVLGNLDDIPGGATVTITIVTLVIS